MVLIGPVPGREATLRTVVLERRNQRDHALRTEGNVMHIESPAPVRGAGDRNRAGGWLSNRDGSF